MTSGRPNHWRFALRGLAMVGLLTWAGVAAAAGATIASVAFTGTNADLTITISGSGFGLAPPHVPCKSCATPYLNIGGRIGCSGAYNIASWTPSRIILSGFQGSPGGDVIISVENPQNKTISVKPTAIPSSITITSSPKIDSVVFTGSGRNLKMTISGSGFGTAPRNVPGDLDVPFFAFVDLPFDAGPWGGAAPGQWGAGYESSSCGWSNSVTLRYASWSPTRIAISGFGPNYGRGPRNAHKWTVSPGDIVTIFVANSGTGGLALSYTFNVLSPLGTGTLWGGLLP
jgi:hypothetical protein